ncbi:MAG: glutamine synthetase family protein [Pseudomonadota bacterium]|nr:glutamine synthetase family protein [Pseudomonadota bacterium]
MTPEALAFVGTCDLAGMLRGKSFPLAELQGRMGRGVGVTPSNLLLSVFGPIYETPFGTRGELMLIPDAVTQTAIPVPGAPDIQLLLGEFHETNGAPWPHCPRRFLRRALDALRAEFGLTLFSTFEQELVYTGVEAQAGSPYTLEALRRQGSFGGTLLTAMRQAGIAPDSFLSEYGPRQFEVTTGPVIGLAAADQAVLLRELVRAVAHGLGERAILAPMITPDGTGNGTHIHWSLLDANGQPATHDPAGQHGLSAAAEHMAAGMLHHLPALAAITAPSVASYYRLRPGRWAPTSADLGDCDRGSAVRVCPVYALGAESVARQFNVEFRVADAAASPYLALGAIVWAGLDGLRHCRRLGEQRPAPLPATLAEALDHLQATPEAADWFGPLLDVYLLSKRAEIRALAGFDEAAICDRYAAIY